MEEGSGKKQPHAILISVPYQGHLIPSMHLALKLASRGIIVTFAHLEFVHHNLCKLHHRTTDFDFFSEIRQTAGLDIRYMIISDGLDPVQYDRDLNFEEYWEIIFRDFPARVDKFVAKIIESSPQLSHFLVADTVYEWPLGVAEKHNLVHVSFWTQPALAFSLCYHAHLLHQNGHCPCPDDIEEEIKYIPGVESINTKDLMSFLKKSGEGTIIQTTSKIAFAKVKRADFILHNTVEELESETLSALNTYQPNYAIGPIAFSKGLPSTTLVTTLQPQSDCTNWLDSKPPRSVLYVSLGSFIHANKDFIEELACGLLLSGVNFVWVFRHGLLTCGESDVLPAGYREEIDGRGLIVAWCDQKKVLSNLAVGGFLTHCGWNSTVESIWCGVPMICCPFLYDQPVNRKLVVEDWKIGMSLFHGTTSSLNRAQVAQTINNFMSPQILEKLTQETNRLNTTFRKALEIDGSSEKNFDKFIVDLRAKLA